MYPCTQCTQIMLIPIVSNIFAVCGYNLSVRKHVCKLDVQIWEEKREQKINNIK